MHISTLGIAPGLITAGITAADAFLKGGKPMPSAALTPGTTPDTGISRPSATTVSPAFQQSFTPQVSPVITAQIQSEGATAIGAPTQQTSGGQRAAGGGYSPPGSDRLPYIPSLPRNSGFPSAFADPFNAPILQRQQNFTPIITTGIIAAAAIAGIILFNRYRRLK